MSSKFNFVDCQEFTGWGLPDTEFDLCQWLGNSNWVFLKKIFSDLYRNENCA
jgi:hypothetical protein